MGSDPRAPLLIELGAQNQRHDEAVTANAGLDAVGLEILVVDLPARSLQQRPAPPPQTFGDVVDVPARTGLERRSEQPAIVGAHLPAQLPIEKHPAAVPRARIPLQTRQPADEVRL